ncbi:NADH-quinone oxidoreductase subunit K [candidate division WOR-1 bacterium RIFCSPHIGHO2_01_FULL_53_15]|uniref:NADH-quinone oxidoreductase subunit K n=1 Tax=candidate division WOR-1 bacterium RIFCSPHIGHO2_01_FULL_53_15 TaxID=1802564 RepID=A0A1F4Q3P7_UNCSA|nr:MAG: NADH-quinone oxidoreductase subunit K [candidate division WOR-1 bacterium RIFCSPHIGHO2_01_FULL_53_15]
MDILAISLILFGLGLFGALTRKNAVAILMSIELMLNAVNLNFVYFSRTLIDLSGQIFTLFIIAAAAAEAAIGLAIILNLYREFGDIDVEKAALLKW